MTDLASYMTLPSTGELPYPPVTQELLAEIVRRIRTVGQPLKIVLFGSRAVGRARADSDIDILVIEGPDVDCRDREIVYWDVLSSLFPPVEVLVHTIRDVASWQAVPNSLLTRALADGKTLFEDEVRLPKYYGTSDFRNIEHRGLIVCEGSQPKTQADLAKEWFTKADSDLETVKTMLAYGTRFDTACFHAQQAIEKYLKGFLSLHGFSWKRTHNLDVLRWQCLKVVDIPGLKALVLGQITSYCAARYAPRFWPTREDAEAALQVAEKVRAAILAAVAPESSPSDQ
ncbi:MAG TPA: HEPN domain-containing protein [Candidatus Obscuribacterales bacterium]